MTTRIMATSDAATAAFDLVAGLQRRFVQRLEGLAQSRGEARQFIPVEWLRDKGRRGGGIRLEIADSPMIGRGSVNASQVHYGNNPDTESGSASALSTIIHPAHPHAPSVHIHISWTEWKIDDGYWRMMADLNPAIEDPAAAERFIAALRVAAPEQFEKATTQGDRYFYIPALKRHRGVAHFYLENYNSNDFETGCVLAQSLGEAAIDIYVTILDEALKNAPDPTDADLAAQLAYHTLYFFQVLTLDRGTTAGILAHDQNNIGIMGSLPSYVDRGLLASWQERIQPPQDQLLSALLDVLPHRIPCLIDAMVKQRIVHVVRSHYRTHPEALTMQASGGMTHSEG